MQIFSPKWFYGYDALTELLSIIIVILIAVFSVKAYRFTQNRNYLYLAYSFILIAFSFAIKIITNLIAYYQPIITTNLGRIVVKTYDLEKMAFIFSTGYFFYRITILFAFLIILLLALKVRNRNIIALFSFFIVITTLFSSQQYFIFHITCVFMLIFISHYFIKNWKKRRTESSLTLAISFLIILLSQVVFIFVIFDKSIYVIAELFQLMGYLMLLYTYMLVLRRAGKAGRIVSAESSERKGQIRA